MSYYFHVTKFRILGHGSIGHYTKCCATTELTAGPYLKHDKRLCQDEGGK